MAVLKNIVSKIFNLGTTPSKKTEGQFWYDTTNNVLKRSDGTDYKPLPVGDNLISAGSTNTVKGILDSKANASDLSNYLPLTGGIIAREAFGLYDPILTIHDTEYGFGTPPSGLLVKGGVTNGQDDTYYSTYICPDIITGDAVTSSINSNSSKLLTSGGAYTALQNKQDKLSLITEVSTGGSDILYLGDTSDSAYSWIRIGNESQEIELYSRNIIVGFGEYDGNLIINSSNISGSAIVSTIGTSTTSTKLPTEGAVVKAISDVKTSLGSALTYEGSVENYSNLPTGLTASDKGKVYNVVNANGNIPAGTNYAWNGTSWDALGGDYTALRDYIDDNLDDKITKNTDAELNAFIMPTYNSSGVQNGKAKIKLYKDDTTGAITIEAEEIIE